ncbi:UNVERIFIED_CONTAM: hypothetical protein FKN15_038762 [Acipenser sinensis]
MEPTAVLLRTVTRQLSLMRGSGLLQLHLGETAFDYKVWIVDIQDQFIIRLDFLQKVRGQLDLERGTVKFGVGPLLLLDMPVTALVSAGTTTSASRFKGSCKWCWPRVRHRRKMRTVAAVPYLITI